MKQGGYVIFNAVKRGFDLVLVVISLIAFSPLFLLCYWRIKKEDGGKAIFRQERIGLHGQPFTIYKFRSTRLDVKDDGYHLFTKGEDDEMLTRTGKFLRAYHLDELPQLWNVLKGDMSFVGYRPERKYYIDQIMELDSRYEQLYQIRPGVTSKATLYNGYTDTMEKMLKRLEMDLDYLNRRSWGEDLKIIFLTITHVMRGKKF